MNMLTSSKKTLVVFLKVLIFFAITNNVVAELYLGALGGVTLTRDLTMSQLGTDKNATLPSSVKLNYNPGFNGGLFVGYKLIKMFRTELEVVGLRSEYSSIEYDSKLIKGSATTTIYGFANGIIEFPGFLSFYLGAGIGAARIADSNEEKELFNSMNLNKNQKTVSYQGILGFSTTLGNFSVFLDYRYMLTHEKRGKDNLVNNTINIGGIFSL